MPDSLRVIPTTERPFRAIPVEVEKSQVQGEYQAVVTLPGKPTKGKLLLAYAEACRSLADLAEKWASEEGVVLEDLPEGEETAHRIYFTMKMRPEAGVDHSQISSIATHLRGLWAGRAVVFPSKDAIEQSLIDSRVPLRGHPLGSGVEISENNRVVSRFPETVWPLAPNGEQYESD